MLKNYLFVAFRNLHRGGLYSFLNLAGLTIGTATVILLMLFVYDELSFDKFHEKSDRIYRAWVKEHYEGEVFFNTVTPYVLGGELRENFPEIQTVTRYAGYTSLVKNGSFTEQEDMLMIEPEFFQVFDFTLLRGKKELVFDNLHQIVLTEEMGEKYFGDPYPIGQSLTMQFNGEWTDFTVSGVVDKAPGNSSLQFDFLFPFAHLENLYSEGRKKSWTSVSVETYVLLNKDNDVADLSAKVAPFVDGKVADDYEPGEYIVGFQPLTDIHLNNDFPRGMVDVSDGRYPGILSGVALLILLLAAINFTTIAVGRSVSRAKEIGVRKVTGASRLQLMMQFWTEAILTAAVSVFGGVILVELALPFFNSITDKQLAFDFSVPHVTACASLALLTGLISGIYPALVQAGFSPIRSLKGMVSKVGDEKHLVLRGLVGFQFLLSILLIGCTLIMGQQLEFLQGKNLGFEEEQTIVIPFRDSGLRFSELLDAGGQMTKRLKSELSDKNEFLDFSWSNHTFGTSGWMRLGYTSQADGAFKRFYLNGIGADFISMMGIELLEGRHPDVTLNPSDKTAVVVNEEYAKMYGVSVGQPMQEPFQDYMVVGISKDFHFQSLHSKVEPLVLAAHPLELIRTASDIMANDTSPKISVKVSSSDLPATLSVLRQAWKKVAPEQAFDYTFLDENINRQYRSEERFSQVVSYSTVLAIFIACLGLFGIATLSIAKRKKEIGVRKVLGATTADIIFMLNKNFTFLVLGASILALPLAWYFMSAWLDDFAYRIDLSPISLALGGVFTLALTWLIVGWRSFHAASLNPVDSLRSE